MKHKISLLAVMLAGVISTNTFALEVNKGRIIAHKEWTTGIAKGSFSSKPMTKRGNEEDTGSFYISSHAEAGKTQAGVATPITGSTQVMIYNASKETQRYDYNLSVCSNMDDHTASCIISFYSIELEPNGNFSDESMPKLIIAYDKAGTYSTYVHTFVNTNQLGSNHPAGYFQVSSSSNSSIEVS